MSETKVKTGTRSNTILHFRRIVYLMFLSFTPKPASIGEKAIKKHLPK